MPPLRSLDYSSFIPIRGFPNIRCTFSGVPIIRIIEFWGLYRGPVVLGNCHIPFSSQDPVGSGQQRNQPAKMVPRAKKRAANVLPATDAENKT